MTFLRQISTTKPGVYFPSIYPAHFFTSKLDLNLRKKLVKFYIWSVALYGAET
jgi:hypothetical protein